MTLNASGPISLSGTTAGQSIEIELGGTGTTQISLNCTTVRTLAGVASGAIVMPTNFYGKSNVVVQGTFYGGCSNLVTRINACGALVGSETNAGTARSGSAGTTVGANGLFYGGEITHVSNLVTRINACGALVGSETNAGTARYSLAGATVGANGLFYGGCAGGLSNLVTRINACGALVGSQTNVGTARFGSAGAGS